MAKKQKIVEVVEININTTEEGIMENTENLETKSEEAPAIEETPVIEAAAEVAVEAEPEEKKKRVSVSRDDVKARRAQVADAVFQAISAASKPLSRADVSRAADDILGRPGDSTSWVDGGVALQGFIKGGVVAETKLEGKKKTLYNLTPATVEDAPAEGAPAAE